MTGLAVLPLQAPGCPERDSVTGAAALPPLILKGLQTDLFCVLVYFSRLRSRLLDTVSWAPSLPFEMFISAMWPCGFRSPALQTTR